MPQPSGVPSGTATTLSGGHRKVTDVTTLVIRHHLRDDSLLDAVTTAPWVSDAGFDDVRERGLLARESSSGAEEDVTVSSGEAPSSLVLVLVDHAGSDDERQALGDAVLGLAREAPVLAVGATVDVLPDVAEVAGVMPGGWVPRHEIRVRPEPGVDPRRLEDLLLTDRLLVPAKVLDDVTTLATANVGFRDHAVATWRAPTGVGTLLVGTDPGAWHRDVLRLVRHLSVTIDGRGDAAALGVGMLGYGAIGHEHALATLAVPGLHLSAVSDPNPSRVSVARSVNADVRGYSDSDEMLDDDAVDLVVISTPPDTHADWARRALAAGKHVVLEKPMALTAADCDDVLERARSADRLVVVYQNRRFDPDYRVMRRLVRSGAIGELFHVESFVGGYAHPCNYWHSHATVSGGAIFDWGSHYIDQLLDLMPGQVQHVTAANHKRHWHDVTNADHSRVTIRFTDGREADFIHSDLAAAPKPKWWALGTHGAIRGDWRSERVVSRTAIGTLDEDVLALADSPARMSLHAPDGSVTDVAVPPAPAHMFHRELADHLLRGLPMQVTAEQSRQVVAVMDAAEQSAAAGATPVPLP